MELSKEEITRMAREAGGYLAELPNGDAWLFDDNQQLERFAALVAAHERNRHAWTQEHWTEYEHAIAAAEREACAKVCDDYADKCVEAENWEAEDVSLHCAAAIRAKG